MKKKFAADGSQEGSQEPVESVWNKLEPAPSDPVFGLIHHFLDDQSPKKVLLGVGAYRDDEGKPVVLDCVKKAEAMLLDMNMNKEYAFPDGIPSFKKKAMEMAYG